MPDVRHRQMALPGQPPNCVDRSTTDQVFSPRAFHGHPAVLVLVGADAGEQGDVLIAQVAAGLAGFAVRHTAVACITGDGPERVRTSPVPVLPGADYLARCGVGAAEALVVLLDRDGRIVFAAGSDDPDIAGACLRCLDHLPSAPDENPPLETLLGPLATGERLPACFGMAHDRTFHAAEQQYGRAAVMVLVGSAADPHPIMIALARGLEALACRQADILLVTEGNPMRLAADAPPPTRIVDGGDFIRRCGLDAGETRVLVADRNQRIALDLRADAGTDILAACLSSLDALPWEPACTAVMPAPVLLLPNLLPPEMCRHLIRLFDSRPALDSGVARVDAAGRIGNVVDYAKKRRRDMMIEPGTGLHAALHETLLRRCRPEIQKAFQRRVGFLDRILVACYDETGGWFRRHRDNEADNVAFREFALSLNLNTGDYEGGHLLFPEYSDHRHVPPAGAGVIFSTSVLHEAAPVTAGRRYVLLTFLHGEAAEARRLDWLAQTAEDGISPR